MPHLAQIAHVVRDYNEALPFYVGTLGFEPVEDSYQPAQDKRLSDPNGIASNDASRSARLAPHLNNDTGTARSAAPARRPRPLPDTPADAPD